MSLLTNAEITDLRGIVNSLLLFGTAIIQRPTYTTNEFGEHIASYSAIGTVSSRLDPLEKQRDVFGVGTDRADDRQWYTLTVKWNQDIESEDQIVVGTHTYEIVRVFDNQDLRVARRLILAEITND